MTIRRRYLPPLLLFLAIFFSGKLVAGAPLKLIDHRLDGTGDFIVTATVPEGTRHAVLEALLPDEANKWRPMLATPVNGSVAAVEFRLPRNGKKTILARVRAGTDAVVPAAEITDATRCEVVNFTEGPTEREKADILDAAILKMKDWAGLPRAERQQKIVEWIKAANWKWVRDASITPTLNSVSISLTDGSTLLLIAKAKPDEADLGRDFPPGAVLPVSVDQLDVPAAAASARAVAPLAGGPRGLPESRRAVCAFALEKDFPNSSPIVAEWLRTNGYTATLSHLPWVEDVLGWFDSGPLGVLFWHAHGIDYKEAGKHFYAIALTQRANLDPGDTSYFMMRKNHEIGMAGSESEPGSAVYTLTHRFVQRYMKFAPHSVVVLDACNGAHPLAQTAFRQAGAGVYASWNAESGKQSNVTLERLFDRLLGTNSRAPISNPPERSFALPEVMAWMDQKGYDFDPTFTAPRTRALLKFSFHLLSPAHILKPSIRNIDYDSGTGTRTAFRLYGDFGKDLRNLTEVRWGERSLAITDWDAEGDLPGGSASSIAVDPGAPPFPVGDFKVRIRQVHESNETPMSEWNVPFTYKLTGLGTLQYTIKSDLKLRADVHGYRLKPQDPVIYPMFAALGILDDCTGTIAASGSYHRDPPLGAVTTWGGGSALRSYNPSGAHDGKNFLMQLGYFSPATGQFLSFGYQAKGQYTHDGQPVDGALDPVTVAGLKPAIDPQTWRLLGGKFAGDATAIVLDYGVSAETSWPDRNAANPPNHGTAR